MKLPHIVAEVVSGIVVAFRPHCHLVAGRIAGTEVSVIDVSLKRRVGDIRDIWSAFQQEVSSAKGSHQWYGYHPLIAVSDQFSRVHTLELVATLHHRHVVVFYRSIYFHSFILQVYA